MRIVLTPPLHSPQLPINNFQPFPCYLFNFEDSPPPLFLGPSMLGPSGSSQHPSGWDEALHDLAFPAALQAPSWPPGTCLQQQAGNNWHRALSLGLLFSSLCSASMFCPLPQALPWFPARARGVSLARSPAALLWTFSFADSYCLWCRLPTFPISTLEWRWSSPWGFLLLWNYLASLCH